MTGKVNVWLAIVLCLYFLTGRADVYHCKDKDGKSIFSDTECAADQRLIKKIENIEPANVASFSVINPAELPDNQQVIFQGSLVGYATRYIKISVFEQTDQYLILDVVGYFSGNPKGKLEFRVAPNMHWRASTFVTAGEAGLVRGYSRISLSSKNKNSVDSDILSLQMWHYSPENKATFLGSQTIPFKKHWVK